MPPVGQDLSVRHTFRILRERWFGLGPIASERGVLARGVPLPALAGSASSAAASSASALAAALVAGEISPEAASSYICATDDTASLIMASAGCHTSA